jgi:hypothetical protein
MARCGPNAKGQRCHRDVYNCQQDARGMHRRRRGEGSRMATLTEPISSDEEIGRKLRNYRLKVLCKTEWILTRFLDSSRALEARQIGQPGYKLRAGNWQCQRRLSNLFEIGPGVVACNRLCWSPELAAQNRIRSILGLRLLRTIVEHVTCSLWLLGFFPMHSDSQQCLNVAS